MRMQARAPKGMRFYEMSKRLFDLILSAVALIALLPVMIALAAWVRIDSPGPILFLHPRVGRHGKPFRMLKLRTMASDAHNLGKHLSRAQIHALQTRFKLAADPRVTRAGRVLRLLSLDELPQLVNILRGEMSFVGPRPVTRLELETHFGAAEARVLSVRPGLTGYWQVGGRSAVAYSRRVQMELFYVAHRGWKLDLLVLFRTLPAVLRARGAL